MTDQVSLHPPSPAARIGPARTGRGRTGRVRTALVVGAACLACYVATLSGHLLAPDDEIQFRTTEALATRASTAIEPLGGFATRPGPDGREHAQYGIGMPLLALPFYAVGAAASGAVSDDAVARLFAPTTQYHEGSRREWMTRWGASLFNSVVTAATVALLCWHLLGWGLERRAALMASLLFGLGSYPWAHARTFFSEPAAALFLFAAFALLTAWHDDALRGWARPVVAGLLAGYAFLIRKDAPFFFPGLCLYATLPALLPPFERRDRRAIAGAFVVGAGMVALMAVQFGVARLQFGSGLALGYEDQPEGIAFSAPLYSGLYGFLFSYGRGLFFASPPLLLALLGARRWWRARPREALGALMCALPFFLLMCRWQNWAGGWSWGPRHIYQVHVFLALPMAGFFLPTPAGDAAAPDDTGARRRRAWGWPLVVVGALLPTLSHAIIVAAVTGGLMLASGIALLAWPSNLSHDPASATTSLPRAPDRWIAAALALAVGAAVQLYACSQSFIDYYMLYFRLPDIPPTSRALYLPGEAEGFVVSRAADDGRALAPAPLSASRIPAPINDSVYVPQNSAWYAYAEMWRAGFHDFFWLHALRDDALPAATSLDAYRHARAPR